MLKVEADRFRIVEYCCQELRTTVARANEGKGDSPAVYVPAATGGIFWAVYLPGMGHTIFCPHCGARFSGDGPVQVPVLTRVFP